ncbi:MAG: hypothetical protein ACOX5A_03255 [Aminivibrio sp.]|jgi:hypothetical protein|nr:hypothetical protein [Synergistaceae bacterium]
MRDLFEKTNYLLEGGVVSLLSDFLSIHASRGLIARAEGADLAVLDAFGAPMESLFLAGAADLVGAAFPSPPLRGSFDASAAPVAGDWPWALRLRGKDWCFYILLGEEPSPELMEEAPAFCGLLGLWQMHQKMGGAEERLSRTAYMILATKNTLASIFEPMGLDYFGSFLHDVISESLFPSKLLLLLDHGGALSVLEGDDTGLPPRKGIFSRAILSPAPVRVEESHREFVGDQVFDLLARDWQAVLPIPGAGSRLFCLLSWEKLPDEEAFNFMELLGNVASKALSLAELNEERDNHIAELSRGTFMLRALHGAALTFMEQDSKEELLLRILDIFSEMAQAPESFIVAWQPSAGGYIHFASRKDGRVEKRGAFAGFPLGILEGDLPESCSPAEAREIFRRAGVPDLAELKDLENMDRIYPLWDGQKLAGFTAISKPLSGTSTMDGQTLGILARTASVALKKSQWDAPHLAAGRRLDLCAIAEREAAGARYEIKAEGGSPVTFRGPADAGITSEQERVCRLVIRSDGGTACVSESAVPGLSELFPASAGWTAEVDGH